MSGKRKETARDKVHLKTLDEITRRISYKFSELFNDYLKMLFV